MMSISNLKTFLRLTLLVASLWGSVAQGMEVSYTNTNPFGGGQSKSEGFLLKGEIVPGDYAAILQVIEANPERFWRSIGVTIASPGGDIAEALKIARLVNGTFRSVFVGKFEGPCVSACFFIYAAAARRASDLNLIGVHRPYLHPSRIRKMSPRESEVAQNDIQKKARAYLVALHVSTDLIDKMFQKASTEVHWLTEREVASLGLRPPWYEQYLIERCGLNKEIERRYFEGSEQGLLTQILDVDMCGTRLSDADARAFLSNEIKLQKAAGSR